MMWVLDDDVKREITAHAREEYPKEACGLVVRAADGMRYLPCANTAAEAQDYFEIGADDWVRAAETGGVLAVVHSHPDGTPFLSGADRQMHARSHYPWVLAAGSPASGFTLHVFRPCAHLRGRVFEYGKSDCGTLIRDALMLCGADFADAARASIDGDIADGIWPRCLAKRGFVRVAENEAQALDVVLTCHNGKPAHAALYLGGGEILHHPLNGLSRREPYCGYWQGNTHSVWRHPRIKPSALQAVLNDLEYSE